MANERTGQAVGAWPLIGATLLGTAAWMAAAGLRLDASSAVLPLAACLGLEALAAFYTYRRPDIRIATTLRGLAQLVAFTAVAAALSYAAAATGGALWDGRLFSWDGALGLDWRAYLLFLDARPWVETIYTIAYQSLTLQIFAVVTVLGFSGRVRESGEFVLAFVLAGLIAIPLSGLMPAVGTYAFFSLHPSDYPHIDPAAPFLHIADLNGLRSGTFRMMSLRQAQGIITFPSYHAALGVIFALALWPVRWIRWPALLLNILLLAATPIDGGHYFSDVIAGSAIGAVAMAAARTLLRRWTVADRSVRPRLPGGSPVTT